MRSRISAAALRVNVMARMFAGSTPRLRRLMYRRTRTLVLPVPADASRTTFSAGSSANARAEASASSAGSLATVSTAANRFGCVTSLIADVILAAHCRVRAPGAQERVLGTRRKFAALDAVDGADQALLTVRHGRREILADIGECPFVFERDVTGA